MRHMVHTTIHDACTSQSQLHARVHEQRTLHNAITANLFWCRPIKRICNRLRTTTCRNKHDGAACYANTGCNGNTQTRAQYNKSGQRVTNCETDYCGIEPTCITTRRSVQVDSTVGNPNHLQRYDMIPILSPRKTIQISMTRANHIFANNDQPGGLNTGTHVARLGTGPTQE